MSYEQQNSSQSQPGADPNQGAESQQDAGQRSSTSAAWQEVGRQFTLLGETISDAFRASWSDPENRRRMQAMQGDLQNMVKEVDRAVRDSANSPQAQRAKAEAQRAGDTLRTAGEETAQEVRPRLLAALKQVNEELRKLVDRMEGGGPGPSSGTGSSGGAGPYGSTGPYGGSSGTSASGSASSSNPDISS
jgi:hypothetical protein